MSNLFRRLFAALLSALLAVLITATTATGQTTAVTGSVPSGPASNQVIRLTLRDAINMVLRYNLGAIEAGQNARIARGQRLLALRQLLTEFHSLASDDTANRFD